MPQSLFTCNVVGTQIAPNYQLPLPPAFGKSLVVSRDFVKSMLGGGDVTLNKKLDHFSNSQNQCKIVWKKVIFRTYTKGSK